MVSKPPHPGWCESKNKERVLLPHGPNGHRPIFGPHPFDCRLVGTKGDAMPQASDHVVEQHDEEPVFLEA